MGYRSPVRAQRSVMVRSVFSHDLPIPPAPDLSETSLTATVSWLREVWQVPEIAAAVRHSSPDLACEIDQLDGDRVDAKILRRLTLALLGYVLRLLHRPTPFGLHAGVAEGRFAGAADVHWGLEHRTRTRPSGAWLAAVVQQLEAVPEVRQRLRLCANNSLRVRGERLVLPWQPRRPEETGTAVREVSVRHTALVRDAVQLTGTPARYGDVERELRARHPNLDLCQAGELLDLLISQRMLLTSLQPTGTETDSLGHVVRELERVMAAQDGGPVADLAAALREIHAQMRVLDQQDPVSPAADQQRTTLTARMRQIADRPSPLAVDTRLDADLVLPRAVAWEAEMAADALARLTPEPEGTQAWIRYRERFRKRYGDGTLVPLADLLDVHSGLGLPEDFHGTALAPEPAPSHRDRLLVTLAQRAWAQEQDLVLDEDLIEQLSTGKKPEARNMPAHFELLASVYAASAQRLDAGEFELAVHRVSRGWGHFGGGRFAALLTEQDKPSDLVGMLGRRPTTVHGALPVQLSFPALLPAADSITYTPRLAPLISLSEYRPADPDVITPSDLAVTCHQGRLHLVSLSRGCVLEAAIPHPLQLEFQTPTIARFLDELERGQSSRLIGRMGHLTAWDWGAVRHLPIQPRVRVGRSILSPATWRLAHAGLPGPHESTSRWDDAFATLREHWRLPRHVYLQRFDQRLRLDLEHPTHRLLLRSHMGRHRIQQLTLTETEPDDAYGWCGGRAHEVVVYLAAPPARPAPALRGAPVVHRDHEHLPGASRYLSVRLDCQPQVRRALMADHLPDLTTQLTDGVWWITSHDDYAELTIRVSDPADAAETIRLLGVWAKDLTTTGVLGDFALVPYRPHVGLWGTGKALTAAENALGADTEVIAFQHAHLRDTVPQPVLTATSLIAIVAGMHQDAAEGLRWLAAEPKPTTGTLLPRDLLQQTRALATPGDRWAKLRRAPDGADLVDGPWARRHKALATYREELRHSPHSDPNAVLRALLTAHLRHIGGSPDSLAWRLARAIALADTRSSNRRTT